jgi:hypothetical protein
MSTTLDLITEKLPELSVKELLVLQEKLTSQLHQRLEPAPEPTVAKTEQPLLLDLIPGAYRLTQVEADEILLGLVTPQELKELRNRKSIPLSVPGLSKRLVDYIDEDREDRPLPQLLNEVKTANG